MNNESLNNLLPAEMVALARFCKAGLIVLNARLFTLLGMILSACAFGYVLYAPDWTRCVAACAFAVLVFWPLQRMEARRIVQQQAEGSE